LSAILAKRATGDERAWQMRQKRRNKLDERASTAYSKFKITPDDKEGPVCET
jgi:hypothetical protein